MHGDLKPANLVATEQRVRIVDFGLAESTGGTRDYAAPERLAGQGEAASDVYALGIVLGELLTGQPSTQVPECETPWLGELISRMLAEAPHHRPTAEEIADAFGANGHPQRPPDLGLLRRRAATLRVPQPLADDAIARCLEEGGRLALRGPEESGQLRMLEAVAWELRLGRRQSEGQGGGPGPGLAHRGRRDRRDGQRQRQRAPPPLGEIAEAYSVWDWGSGLVTNPLGIVFQPGALGFGGPIGLPGGGPLDGSSIAGTTTQAFLDAGGNLTDEGWPVASHLAGSGVSGELEAASTDGTGAGSAGDLEAF